MALTESEEMARDSTPHWEAADDMLVGLSARELRGWAWPVAVRRTRPERPIDERELSALLARALRLTSNRLAQADASEWLLVDAAPVTLEVDGRGVTDPVGFRGQEMGATVFAALARVETIEAWRHVAQRLGFSTLTLTAAPLALAGQLAETQGILLDVGGATTDLTWWRAAKPVALSFLPIGGGALTHSLIRKWGLSLDKAENLKLALASGRLADEVAAQVLEAMTPTLTSWLDRVTGALSAMSESADQPLPHRVYLLGGGGLLPEISQAARSLAWSPRIRFERYPQIDWLRASDIPGVVNHTDLGREAGDVSAWALAGWAVGQFRPPDRAARILRGLCQRVEAGG
jgi:cell division protein FtsA